MLDLQAISTAAEKLSLTDKLTLLSHLVEWIKRDPAILSISEMYNDTIEDIHSNKDDQSNFWRPSFLKEIMRQQGITEPQTIRPLEGFDDDVDEMVATIHKWRREGL